MRDLCAFVLARAADDEEIARQYGDPRRLRSSLTWASDADRPVLEVDPARIIAECEAKRRVVAHYLEALENYRVDPPGEVEGAGVALRALALPYADHPEYDPEWRLPTSAR